VLDSQVSVAGHSDQAETIVPAFARALPRSASSDYGSERIFRGRDNLESWLFSFGAPLVVGTCEYVCFSVHKSGRSNDIELQQKIIKYDALALTSTVVNFMF